MTSDPSFSDSAKNLTDQLDINFALQAAGLGIWEYNPGTGLVSWDERARSLYGIAETNYIPYEQAIQHIYPDDAYRVNEAVQWAINPQSGGSYNQTYRTIGVDDGKLRWVHFQGQASFSDTGNVYRFGGIAQEVTEQMQARQHLEQARQQLHSIIQQTPAPTLVLRGDEYRIDQINQPMLAFMGRGEDVVGQPLLAVMPELAGQFAWQQVQQVYREGVTFDLPEILVPHVRNGELQDIYYNVSYRPLRENGQITGMIQVAVDVTEQVLSRHKLEDSELFARTLFERSPIAKAVFVGQDMVIRTANKNMLSMWGKEDTIVGLPFMTAMPELVHTPQLKRLRQVMATGERFYQAEERFELIRYGVPYTGYYEYTYEALRAAAGEIYGVICVASEVTDQVIARQKLEANQTKLRSVIAAAPAGIGLFVGRDLVIENPNQTFIDIVGKGPDIEGVPLRKAMPELLTEGQPFLKILDDVYTTGVPFTSPASLVKIVQNGVLNDNYYNISYTPLRDADGQIYAILDIAIDVTAQVKAQLALADRETALQNTIELAELGTFNVNVVTNLLTASPRVADWFGFNSLTADTEAFINGVGEEDQDQVRNSLHEALMPDSDGRYNIVHSVINAKTGRRRVLHALGQVYTDAAGQPLRIEGAALDITGQRELQLVLEQRVQQRTEELATATQKLATANEELAATNEELMASNEELLESNELLVRSNANLQQFAYVASHDLQEPLRKIQQFGDLLKTRLVGSMGDQELAYLERMQVAASRMSTLIKDLLGFSRISTQRNGDEPVRLNEVISDVLGVLDLTLAEANAQVQVDHLPTVPGDASQLRQLFQNLISNAIKFSRPGVTSRIRISSQTLRPDELPSGIKPTRRTAFYRRIDVADNGIGFEEKYLDRIFQVFQRLHSRSQYAGTGIGLAICEKVVTNHGGVITANSQPGAGTTFRIYLPVT